MTRKLCFTQSSKYPFDLNKVLYAGQDFRWCVWKDDWHSGVLDGNLIHIRQVGNVLEYKSHSGADLSEMLRSYFRLDDPIDKIYDDLASRDNRVCKLISDYPWLRVLRQPDPWECTVSYICAARSHISTVPKRVEAIAKIGQPVELSGDVRFIFPTPEMVLKAGVERLERLQLGTEEIRLGQIGRTPRAEVILTAAKLKTRDKPYLHELVQSDVSYGKTILRLMGCNGIGPKTANCIALFALNKSKAFPVDRWIRRAVRSYFPELTLWDEAVVHWAQDYFSSNAGYANQFLFYAEREKGQLKRPQAVRRTRY